MSTHFSKNANSASDANNDPSERDREADAGGGAPPSHEDGPLDSIGKAITAPMRDDPGTDVDEKPDGPASPSPARRPSS